METTLATLTTALSTSGKTKYFAVLYPDGVVVKASSKKSAELTLNQFNNKTNETISINPTNPVFDPESKPVATSDDSKRELQLSQRRAEKAAIRAERDKHLADTLLQVSASNKTSDLTSTKLGESTEQHRVNAEQHRVNAEALGELIEYLDQQINRSAHQIKGNGFDGRDGGGVYSNNSGRGIRRIDLSCDSGNDRTVDI